MLQKVDYPTLLCIKHFKILRDKYGNYTKNQYYMCGF